MLAHMGLAVRVHCVGIIVQALRDEFWVVVVIREQQNMYAKTFIHPVAQLVIKMWPLYI